MKSLVYSPEHRKLVQRLTEARKAAGLSQREVARQIGAAHDLVIRLEGGSRKIDIGLLYVLAKLYGTSVRRLMGF